MTFEEYISRYRLLQDSIEDDKRLMTLVENESYKSFVKRFPPGTLTPQALFPFKDLETRIEKKKRLLSKYASRIARACNMIATPQIREYAFFRYLYGMTHEGISDGAFYSLRTVYRHRKIARNQLEACLKKCSRRNVRLIGKKYRFSHRPVKCEYIVIRDVMNRPRRPEAMTVKRPKQPRPVNEENYCR